ncbi:MAG: aspartate 1-decarboxylase, partial [Elusimicrobiales bacterium]|nr:aspartate 1-decarboxylase [Elusimicrobiales bacterium]
MLIEMLKSKIHRAKVTARDINYEGSITIDKKLCDKAKINEFEKVDVYNINNGERFTTYVIYGKDGEIQINGAAARLCEKDDLIIIASYCCLLYTS